MSESEGGVFVDPLESIDTRDPDEAVRLLEEASEANLGAACRAGSIDRITGPGRLIATGDLHDNPLHFARVVRAADLEGGDAGSRHVTLHEVIHSDRLIGGVDFSHRALLRVAALKRLHPEGVHTLLANHELSQIVGAGITKDGISTRRAFNEGIEQTYAGEAGRIEAAVERFIRSMPLALRVEAKGATLLCAHSLPGPDLLERFDPGVLERDLEDADYTPRRGSAHIMVWGRGHTPSLLTGLSERWGVDLFILGHEKAEEGALEVPPNALVLNSDHERGRCASIDLSAPPRTLDAARACVEAISA
jgi:hypothetical protein